MTARAFRAVAGFDQSRTRGNGFRDVWKSFVTATRLGWQMEANWTDPLLFFIYSVAKPLASTLIFVVMIEVIGGNSTREFRAFVVVGSTPTQVFQSLGAAVNRNGAWTAVSNVSLNAYAGQTIRIRFDAADASTASLVEAGVDDVKITQQ